MSEDRSPNPDNGPERDGRGLFAKGNKGGPGNPQAAKVAAYRKAIWDAVSIQDMQDVIRSMVTSAKAGDVAAAKVVLERCAGQPPKDAEGMADDAITLAQFLRQFLSSARAVVDGQVDNESQA